MAATREMDSHVKMFHLTANLHLLNNCTNDEILYTCFFLNISYIVNFFGDFKVRCLATLSES